MTRQDGEPDASLRKDYNESYNVYKDYVDSLTPVMSKEAMYEQLL